MCVVGDSISEGFSPATRGWSVDLLRLNAGRDWGVKNVAQSGDKIAAARLVFDRDVLGHGCTHVAFLIGTNDLPDGTAASTMWAGTKAMVDLARADTSGRAGGAKVLLLALLPRGTGASWSSGLQTTLEAYNTLQSAYGNGSTIVYVDTYTALLEPSSNPPALAAAAGGATDGLHPNNAGEGLIASTVNAAVLAAGGW